MSDQDLTLFVTAFFPKMVSYAIQLKFRDP